MNPLLDVRDLTVGYHRPIVRSVSFHADAGELIGILGRNGCGKTTLLRGILGSAPRVQGELWIHGQNCAPMPPRKKARYLSLLAHHTPILSGIHVSQVMETGCYAGANWLGIPSAAQRQRMADTARLLGITAWMNTPYSSCSEGQKQLVQIARLLVQNTPVVLLDEPDSALDFENRHRMFRLLQSLMAQQEKAGVLVLHDPTAALRYCHRLYLMDQGQFVAQVDTRADSPQQMQQHLRLLYPRLRVWREEITGHLYCDTEECPSGWDLE